MSQQNNSRSIDERLDVLTSNLELQAGMLRDLDSNIHELTADVKALTASQAASDARMSALIETVQRFVGVVEGLAILGADHEQRIKRIEGN